MNPEKQGTALAKLGGWEYVPETERCPAHWWKNEDGCHFCTDDNGFFAFYLSDLNAVHELEKGLTDEQKQNYWNQLYQVMTGLLPIDAVVKNVFSPWITTFATAAQRCEALLKTLGLWKEETE